MSVRGVLSGVAGSAAVAIVAALSLSATHAVADPKRPPPPAPARIAPATQSGAAPTLRPAHGPTTSQPTWLRRLLQRSDPAVEARSMEAKPRRS